MNLAQVFQQTSYGAYKYADIAGQDANTQFHASFLRQFANQTFPKLEIADKSQSH